MFFTPRTELEQRSVQAGLDGAALHGISNVSEHRVRWVGHGVGLELDELPVLAPRQQQPLAAGAVVAVEPKFFFPGKGAVGLENTYAVQPDRVETLTVSSEAVAEVAP